MVKLEANIKLYKDGRKTPFYNGYKPLFNFIKEMKTSGKIILINRTKFDPGDEGIVQITFLNNKFLGKDFKIGKIFFFGERGPFLGEGVVLKILEI